MIRTVYLHEVVDSFAGKPKQRQRAIEYVLACVDFYGYERQPLYVKGGKCLYARNCAIGVGLLPESAVRLDMGVPGMGGAVGRYLDLTEVESDITEYGNEWSDADFSALFDLHLLAGLTSPEFLIYLQELHDVATKYVDRTEAFLEGLHELWLALAHGEYE